MLRGIVRSVVAMVFMALIGVNTNGGRGERNPLRAGSDEKLAGQPTAVDGQGIAVDVIGGGR